MLVTELAERGGLDHLLHKSEAPINFSLKIKILENAASGLNWLHMQSPPLLHLDIKPANLLVTTFIWSSFDTCKIMDDWTVKIADFGMSRFRTDISDEKYTLGLLVSYN